MSSNRGSSDPHQEVLVVLEPENGVDDDERERLVRQLGAELNEMDLESLRRIGGPAAPAGAKGAEALGDWLLTLSASGGVVTPILVIVQDWLNRHRGDHKVKVVMKGDTLELSRASVEEQAEVVQAFLRRHEEG